MCWQCIRDPHTCVILLLPWALRPYLMWGKTRKPKKNNQVSPKSLTALNYALWSCPLTEVTIVQKQATGGEMGTTETLIHLNTITVTWQWFWSWYFKIQIITQCCCKYHWFVEHGKVVYIWLALNLLICIFFFFVSVGIWFELGCLLSCHCKVRILCHQINYCLKGKLISP